MSRGAARSPRAGEEWALQPDCPAQSQERRPRLTQSLSLSLLGRKCRVRRGLEEAFQARDPSPGTLAISGPNGHLSFVTQLHSPRLLANATLFPEGTALASMLPRQNSGGR